MNFRNKYGIILLSATFVLSVLFPVSCHAEDSIGASHHKEIAEQMAHSQHHNEAECSCGHRLIKDFQKNKNVVSSLGQDLNMGLETITFVSADYFSPSDVYIIHFQMVPGSPVHLLNSVFLN